MSLSSFPPPQSDYIPQQENFPRGRIVNMRYSNFLKMVDSDLIQRATFSSDGEKLLGVDKYGTLIKIDVPDDPGLLPQMIKHNIDIVVLPTEESRSSFLDTVVSLLLPLSVFAGLLFLARRGGVGVGGGPNVPMSFGRAAAQVQLIADTGVTFDDVAGCDGAKMELEVVDFLKNPDDYTRNGCKIPRGVILDGPPGTGKTLLAKAVAGEARVPFISISGSEFVEMFVGVGASRVRDLFNRAKENAPCIIFIDEIDAVGRQRGAGFAGGNDEREQTVNQILVELDGFEGNPGVITIAATNRIDILDPALLRPGRFDRKVTVELPDFNGRTKILGVHSRGKPIETDVDLEAIARRTPYFSGAQLENVLNEAAISAARIGKVTIGWEQIDNAVDRIMMGIEKKGGTENMSFRQKEIISYHEAGHAIVGALVPDYDQVQKISIIPRSNGAGGITFFSPQETRLESGLFSKQYLESQLSVALGGHVAEELVFGKDNITTGASNDIDHVTAIARRMVKELGMSDKVGRVAVGIPRSSEPFMGRMIGQRRTHWGQKLLTKCDDEIERIIHDSYEKARDILQNNRKLLDHLAHALIDHEIVTAEEFEAMLIEFKASMARFHLDSQESDVYNLPLQNLSPINI
jgi:cell division protease FtsH